jgi:hypothetical protein
VIDVDVGGASQVQLFFLVAMSYFDWPITKNKLKLWRLPWGTHWEPIEHLMGDLLRIEGTCWDQRKNEKNPHPTLPTQNLKESRQFECMLQPTHWPHVFLISKTVGHHIWPWLMAGAEI